MVKHVLGWLYAFCIAAMFSSGISLAPIAVVWNSIWVYLTFALCLFPGYIAAIATIYLIIFLIGLIGAGAILGAAGGVILTGAAIEKMRRK